MLFFYNILVHLTGFALRGIALFSKKIELFVVGRNHVFDDLKNAFKQEDSVIWFHAASLGEFEQGRPVIEKLKSIYPKHKLLLTFFSPSGYEIRKNYDVADKVVYLPLDTRKNAQKFVEMVRPDMAVFIKYEFWPNFLRELKKQHTHTILISGIFRKEQSFFKWYGAWMKASLETFHHFFVQDIPSRELLSSIGFNNVTISGDTRFDRVFEITRQDIKLPYLDNFKNHKRTLVAGSTWPKDEELLVNFINTHSNEGQKFIIVPHNIHKESIQQLKKNILKPTILFSEKEGKTLEKYQVFIVDTIGLLSKIYKYADMAYVGGGFGSGIHNILEPATFGVPILIGPEYKRFKEAVEMITLGACFTVKDNKSFNNIAQKLLNDDAYRVSCGSISKEYVIKNIGATKLIITYITGIISKK